jgi:hypothetical protein
MEKRLFKVGAGPLGEGGSSVQCWCLLSTGKLSLNMVGAFLLVSVLIILPSKTF